MYSGISTGNSVNRSGQSGVTLIEILIVTVIIGLMAAISFPVFKIIQQREKERRLKKILYDVRSAISGSKSPQSITDFTEGYRTYIRVKGIAQIENAHPANETLRNQAISVFVKNLGEQGLGYPRTPARLTATDTIYVATSTVDPTNDYVAIKTTRDSCALLRRTPF
jgi:prepilin-type N-terminal cleavage/methylation domain-containing protein